MKAEHVVQVLLDGTKDMVKHLARLAVNPAYEFENAITNHRGLKKTFPTQGSDLPKLEIEIKPPIIKTGGIVQIIVRWTLDAPYSQRGGGYASYKIANAKAVSEALGKIVKAAQTAAGSDYLIRQAYHELIAHQWVPRHTTRRRRRTSGFFEANQGIVRDLLTSAVGFGGFMERKPSFNIAGESICDRFEWSKDWTWAGEITFKVFSYLSESDRPNTLRLSMDWSLWRGGINSANVEVNLWDITPAKRTKIVYIMRSAIQQAEQIANEMDAKMSEVHTYAEDEEMKTRIRTLFNKVSHESRKVTDGFEPI